MINPLRRILGWIVLLLLGVPVANAQLDASASSAPPAVEQQDAISRIWDLFQIDLPMTERQGEVKFSFQPHFRDFLNQSYVRVPFELRWGVNDHFEINSYTDTYFTDGLRRNTVGYGISALHFGAKYAWKEWLKPGWDASIGFNSAIPVSRPPLELSDGFDHFTPYIVFARKVDAVMGLSEIFNVSVDLITASSTPGVFSQNEPHSNSMSLTPGLLYDRGKWHYTLEVTGTTTRYIGTGSHDFLTIRPGIVWDLPKALMFHARGRWLAGFNVTLVFGPDGNTISTGGRFRGEVNLTELFGGSKPAGAPPPTGTPGR
jgi:hypothetical protein